MLKSLVRSSHIKKVNADGITDADDLLATEEPLEIRLAFGKQADRQQQNISVTMRTPGNDFELAVGFLFTEGLVSGLDQVRKVRYCAVPREEQRYNVVSVAVTRPLPEFESQPNFYPTSGCRICGNACLDPLET